MITVLEDKPYRILKKWFRDVGFDTATINWINLDSGLDPVNYVEVVQPDYLLLTGAKALGYFQPRLKLTECRGRWWRINGQGSGLDAEGTASTTGYGHNGTGREVDPVETGTGNNTGKKMEGIDGSSREFSDIGVNNDGGAFEEGSSKANQTLNNAGSGTTQDDPNRTQCAFTWVLATYHPAAVLRNRELESQVKSDIATFRFFSYGVFDPAESQECIKCQDLAVQWHQGLGLCPKHKIKEPKPKKIISKKKGQYNQDTSLFT